MATFFERAALEDWVRLFRTNPVTGTPLCVDDFKSADDLKRRIREYQGQAFAGAQIELGIAQGVTSPNPEPPRASGPLGDLPDFGKEGDQAPKKKKKGKIKISSRSAILNAPEEFLCSIDGKLAIDPMRSPQGYLFERKTLEKWFNSCGSVCPITSQPLRMEDCEADTATRKEIVRFLKSQQEG